MRVWVHSRARVKRIQARLRSLGCTLDPKAPAFVLTYGGDGTILEAERLWPGVPKVPLLTSLRARQCQQYPLSALPRIVSRLRSGRYHLREFPKLLGKAKGRHILALNELQVHNADPGRALRFSVQGPKRFRELIGDGLVAATSYGSTAYYRSLGHNPFHRGVRVAGNNLLRPFPPFPLRGALRITVLREHGWFLGDNHPHRVLLKKGDSAVIVPSKAMARFVEL